MLANLKRDLRFWRHWQAEEVNVQYTYENDRWSLGGPNPILRCSGFSLWTKPLVLKVGYANTAQSLMHTARGVQIWGIIRNTSRNGSIVMAARFVRLHLSLP